MRGWLTRAWQAGRSSISIVAILCTALGSVQLAVPAPATAALALSVSVVGLETDADASPLGIDNRHPRLSWRLLSERRGVLQAASQILVASSPKLLTPRKADVWNSGKVRGAQPYVDYAGTDLESRQRYFWAVRVWLGDGRSTGWSKPGRFETAFLSHGEWKAAWIKGPLDTCADDGNRYCPAPLLRTEFDVRKRVASARLYASGLAYGVYEINGERVGNAVLDPGITDYAERVFYVTHDVTNLLQRGRNALGAELGRGFMGMVGPTYAGYPGAWKSEPMLRLELHITYADRSRTVVRTGEGWKTRHGPRRFDDVMRGESFDGRIARQIRGWSEPGFDDGAWRAAEVIPGPAGTAVAQDQEPIRPQRTLAFRSVTETRPGVYLFDLGQNIAGNAIIDLDVPAGRRITLHYAEKLTDENRPDLSGNPDFNGGTIQLDEYVGAQGPDRWRPEFTYKGFRWVEVSGLTREPPRDALTAQVWHSDVAPAGSWRSSNALANQIVQNTSRAIRSNLYSHPTDTPVYEKSGYTGDGQIMAPSMAYLFDMHRFFSKWSTDVEQALTSTELSSPGQLMRWVAPSPETEPVPENSPVTPGWDAALFVVPDVVRRHYGDERPALAALPEMSRYLDVLRRYVTGGTITGVEVPEPLAAFSRLGIGDWANPCDRADDGSCTAAPSKGISADSTAWYVQMLDIMSDTARLAGDRSGALAAKAEAEDVRAAFDARFFDPLLGAYQDTAVQDAGDFSQHVNAIALGLEAALPHRRASAGAALAEDLVARGGNNYTGIMGTRFLWEALTETGHLDTAWTATTQTDYPSYGYWIEELGWTSLGEHWEATTRSRNHHMFGTVVQWLFEAVAGYSPSKPGFAEIEFNPHIPSEGLQWVSARTDTVRGEVATSWRKAGRTLTLEVTVPAGATGRVHLPAHAPSDVSETGTGRRVPAADAPGVRLIGKRGDRVLYRVGSGTYRFVVDR